MGRADLHLHTTASDGSCEPEKLPDLVRSHHLDVFAVTDHDTLGGYDRIAPLVEDRDDLVLIPGVEFTARTPEQQIHILAYDFDPRSTRIRALIQAQIQARANRMKKILSHLETRGIQITLDEVEAQAGSRVVGRPHLARAMVRKRVVATTNEAFMRHLSGEHIQSIETEFVELDLLVKLVRQEGGVTVLAHPGPLFSESEVEVLLESGLDGIEVIHPSHDFEQQKWLRELARSHHLLETGGSDFHGSSTTYAPWLGVVTVGTRHVDSLRRLARHRATERSKKRMSAKHSER